MKPLALIGLVGKKYSGKDSLFEQLQSAADAGKLKAMPIRFAFADALKQELATKLGTTVEKINENKRILRGLLQEHGVNRRSENINYWADKLNDVYPNKEFLYPAFIVVTDVRFRNEAQKIKDAGGKLIRIRRKLVDDSMDKHISEVELNSIQCDNFIYNDEGLGRLKFMALDVLKQMYNGQIVL